MQKAVLTSFGILLLLAIAFPPLLSLYFKSELTIIRHKMEEQLEQQHLQTVVLKKTAVKWHRQNKEIMIGERLFDVKDIVEKEGMIIVKGLFDDEEKKIKNRIELLEKQQSKEKKLAHQLLLKTILLQLFNENIYNDTHKQLVYRSSNPLTDTALILSPLLRMPVPPPRA